MTTIRMRKDNAREATQLHRMQCLAKKGNCFFCGNNYIRIGATPAIHKTTHWYIKKNDYPYKGSIHHYLIASRDHVTRVTNIKPSAWSELLGVVRWLERYLKIKGGSIFVRFGDIRYTGATLDHLHFHLIVGGPKKKDGKIKDNILVTLGHQKKIGR